MQFMTVICKTLWSKPEIAVHQSYIWNKLQCYLELKTKEMKSPFKFFTIEWIILRMLHQNCKENF